MMGYGMTGWMWIWPLLVVVGLLIVGYVVVRLTAGRPSSDTSRPDTGLNARRILDERFARGEIDEDEYQRRRGLLP
jgi:putative membrane protein